MESDQASVQSSTVGVSNEVDSLTGSLSTARSDLAALQQAQAADPSVGAQHGTGDLTAPAKTELSVASKATRAIKQATQTAQSYVDSAMKVLASADALSSQCQ